MKQKKVKLAPFEIGYKFNDFEVVDNVIVNINGTNLIKCKCKCGNIKNITPYNVERKITKSCKGCYLKNKTEQSLPVIGDVFKGWTVISSKRVEKKKGSGHYLFKVRCKCGYEIYRPVYTLKSINYSMCRKCSTDSRVKLYKELPLLYLDRVKVGAKLRHLEYSITPEVVYEIFEKQNGVCALSGLKISLTTKSLRLEKNRKEFTASLDRIDSTKGYTNDNVQWVHKDINQMKSNRTDKDFIELCKKITNFQENKNK